MVLHFVHNGLSDNRKTEHQDKRNTNVQGYLGGVREKEHTLDICMQSSKIK